MIKKIDNIILLGTSHVAKQSIKEIKQVIEEYNPVVIGIELDLNRLKTLLAKDENKKISKTKKKNKTKNKKRTIKEVGVSGYLFAVIAGFIQQKIGKSLGIEAGADMKAAYLIARKNKIPVSLIDIDIKITLKKLSKLGFFKKIKMFGGLFFKSFKKEYRHSLDFDIKKGVPDEEFITKALHIFKKEVPDLYKILLEDRNKYMSKKLLEFRNKNKDGYILGVVGAGHLEGMEKIIKKKIENEEKQEENNINFSFEINVENS